MTLKLRQHLADHFPFLAWGKGEEGNEGIGDNIYDLIICFFLYF